MRKKQFKQYSVLKYKKRIQGSGIILTKESEIENDMISFFASNRVANTFIKSLGLTLKGGGSFHYRPCEEVLTAPCLSIFNKMVLYGPWPGLVNKHATVSLSAAWPLTALSRVSCSLSRNLLLTLSVGMHLKQPS